MNALAVRGLTVRLGGAVILDGVDLAVPAGRLVGLIGPNGAGKSTLVRAALGLVPIETGSVDLLGMPAARLDRRRLARTAAYLPQGHTVQWPMTVQRLVSLGRVPHLQPWQRETTEDRRAIERALTDADVTDLVDRTATTLSGGEWARVALARALAVEAPILLVDEPVASLDPYHQLKVMELLRGYADRRGTVLAVLHDLGLAARFCDTLVLMLAGRVLAHGPPEAVLTADNLATAYRVEAFTGTRHDQRYVVPWSRLERTAEGS